jgi:hypothetical protein
MATIWLKDRLNAMWLVEQCMRRAKGRVATARRCDRYTLVQLPDCSEVRALLDDVGLAANGLYPQDTPIADYRRVNRWRELG